MKSLTIADQQELVILDAICDKQLAVADLEEKLADAHFTLSTEDVEELLDRMEEDHLIVQFQATKEVVGAAITGIGKERLGDLRVLALRVVDCDPRPADITDRVEKIRRENLERRTWEYEHPGVAYPGPIVAAQEELLGEIRNDAQPTVAVCDIPEVPAGEEEIAVVCMTRGSVDAWWNTLTLADKVEAITEYYEALAAQNTPAKDEAR